MGTIITSQNMETHSYCSVYRDDGSVQRVSTHESVYIEEEIPVDERMCVDVVFDIAKAKEDEGLVSGWANVAVNADGSLPLDWQDDIIRPEVLEKAAINFMMDYRGSGVMHQGDEQGVVVESIVLTKDKQAALGIPEGTVPEGWFITVKVTNPEVFQAVKDGKYKMFSIQGNAKRIKLQWLYKLSVWRIIKLGGEANAIFTRRPSD